MSDPGFERRIKRVMAMAIQQSFRTLGHPQARQQTVSPYIGISADDLLAAALAEFVATKGQIKNPDGFAHKVARNVALKELDKSETRRSIVRLVPGEAAVSSSEDGDETITHFDLVASSDNTEADAIHVILRAELVELSKDILTDQEHRIVWRWVEMPDANVIASEQGVGARRVRQIRTQAQAKLLAHPTFRSVLHDASSERSP